MICANFAHYYITKIAYCREGTLLHINCSFQALKIKFIRDYLSHSYQEISSSKILLKKFRSKKICLKLFLRKEQRIQAAIRFLQEVLINIKICYFLSSINLQEQLFHRTLITGYFRPVNIAKFLRTGFLIEHLQNQSYADIPQNTYS